MLQSIMRKVFVMMRRIMTMLLVLVTPRMLAVARGSDKEEDKAAAANVGTSCC